MSEEEIRQITLKCEYCKVKKTFVGTVKRISEKIEDSDWVGWDGCNGPVKTLCPACQEKGITIEDVED